MPIYAYKCETCGHQADVLQKLSEPLLTRCPSCGAETFVKQLTAAGFQLKGSGWYVTDFRDGGGKKPDTAKAAEGSASADGSAATKSDAPSGTSTAPVGSPSAAPAASPSTSSTPAPSASPPSGTAG